LIFSKIKDLTHANSLELVTGLVKVVGEKKKCTPASRANFIALDGSVVSANLVIIPQVYKGKSVVQMIIQEQVIKNSDSQLNQNSSQMFKSVIEKGANYVLFIDQNGLIKYANKPLPSYKLTDVINKSIYNFLSSGNQKELSEALVKVFKSGIFSSFEAEVVKSESNGRNWFICNLSPIYHESNIIAASLVFADITKYIVSKIMFMENEKLLKSIIDANPSGIMVLDKDLYIRKINRTIEKWYQSSENVIGKRCYEVLKDSLDPCKTCSCLETITKGIVKDGSENYRITDEKGNERTLQISTYPLYYGTKNQLEGAIAYLRDITEKNNLKKELSTTQNSFQHVIDNIQYYIYEKDKDLTYITCNKLFAHSVKLHSPKDIAGKSHNDLQNIDNAEVIREEELRVLESNKPIFNINKKIEKEDGQILFYEYNLLPLSDSNGVISGILCIYRDITENKKIEDELPKIIRELEKAIKLKDKTATDEKIEDFEENELNKTLPLGTIIKDRVKVFNNDPKYTISMTLQKDPFGNAFDTEKLSQVVDIIIENSIDAMPDGGAIDIEVKNLIVKENENIPLAKGRYIKLSIQDHGKGFEDIYSDKIFSPFYTTKKDRSGLGLTIANSIVKSLKGHISVESFPGDSTTFTIFLPFLSKSGEFLKETEFKHKRRILVVDKEMGIRDVIMNIVSRFGYEVVCTPNLGSSLRLYKRAYTANDPFKAVFINLGVSGSGGCKKLMKKLLNLDPKAKGFITSKDRTEPLVLDHKKYGFHNAIIKPFKFEDLKRILEEKL